MTIGIEKPGCLLSPQRNQIRCFNLVPPSHSSPANYFSRISYFTCPLDTAVAQSWPCLSLYVSATFQSFLLENAYYLPKTDFRELKHWFWFCLVYWFQSNLEMLNGREWCCCNFHYPQLHKGVGFDCYRWEGRLESVRQGISPLFSDAWLAAG